jgi:endonuclease V-like protein UPF0215 family
MPAFRSQVNVAGRVARKSLDTWLSLMVASKVWSPAVMVTAVSRPEVSAVADGVVADGPAEEGAAELDGDDVAGADASGVVEEQAVKAKMVMTAATAPGIFFMADVFRVWAARAAPVPPVRAGPMVNNSSNVLAAQTSS